MNFLRFIILRDFHGEKIPALDGGIEESFYLLIVVVKLILLYSRFHSKSYVNYNKSFTSVFTIKFRNSICQTNQN